MKIKRILLICTLFFIVLIVVILSRKQINLARSYDLIDKGDYEMKYRIDENFKMEIYIDSKGNALRTYTGHNPEIPDKNGYYPVSEVKEFLKYAVKKNIFSMNDQMSAKKILDGASVYFEIRIGDKFVRAGGYMPMIVSKNFQKIYTRFKELQRLGTYE